MYTLLPLLLQNKVIWTKHGESDLVGCLAIRHAIAIRPFDRGCEGGDLNMSGLRQVRQGSHGLEKQRMGYKILMKHRHTR